ncbi:MAG: NUDIX domain-containing protein, partial [Nanoarchaeota archaeon]
MKYGTISYLSVREKALMIKKGERIDDPNSGFYTPPGGKLEHNEKGENPLGRLEAVVREVRQETGLILVRPSFKGVILFDNEGRTFPNWPNPDNFL